MACPGRRTYFVYAASYAPAGMGHDPEEPAYTIERFCWCGTDAAWAVAVLRTYQQHGYDFCGITPEVET